MRLLRALLLLGAWALLAWVIQDTLPSLRRWRALVDATAEATANDPDPARLRLLGARLQQIRSLPDAPALAHALAASITLRLGDPGGAQEALGLFATRVGPLQAAVARYQVGPDAPPAEVPEAAGDLARALEGWRLAHRGDTASLGKLLESWPADAEPGFHHTYLRFLHHLRVAPRDLEGAQELVDRLRRLVDRRSHGHDLGLGPDPFDPVVTADPDGTLVLRPRPWRGGFLSARDAIRARKVDVYLALACLYECRNEPYRALFQAEILSRNHARDVAARGVETELERLLYPRPWRSVVRKVAREYGLDPYLVYAVAREESRFRLKAGSPAGAQGLMQLMPATAQWIAQQRGETGVVGVRELRDPATNLDLGGWYLRYLAQKFGEKATREKWTLAAYNAGLGNASRWLKTFKRRRRKHEDLRPEQVIDFPETRNYVVKVLASKERYKALYSDPEG